MTFLCSSQSSRPPINILSCSLPLPSGPLTLPLTHTSLSGSIQKLGPILLSDPLLPPLCNYVRFYLVMHFYCSIGWRQYTVLFPLKYWIELNWIVIGSFRIFFFSGQNKKYSCSLCDFEFPAILFSVYAVTWYLTSLHIFRIGLWCFTVPFNNIVFHDIYVASVETKMS